MSPEEIRLLVLEHGTKARTLGQQFPYEREEVHEILRALFDAPGGNEAVLIDGPRRVGKSVSLYHTYRYLKEEPGARQAFFCDFTDPRFRGVTLSDVVSALFEPASESQPILLVDEIHESGKDDWAQQLKFVVDQRSTRIAVADSAVAVVKSKVREQLVGRIRRISLYPLSFAQWRALLRTNGLPVANDDFGWSEECFEYLRLGGFPAYSRRRGELHFVYDSLRDMVVAQAIRRDIAPLAGLRDIIGPERLLVSRLAHSGDIMSLEDARKSSEASRDTTRHWMRALIDTGLLWELMPFTRSSGKYERKRPKLYAIDTALIAACSLPVIGTADERLEGRLIETAVALALRLRAQRIGGRLSFYSPQSGARTIGETDFILEESNKIYMLEATRGEAEKKVSGLIKRANELSADWIGIVTPRTRYRIERVGNKTIHFVPLHQLLMCLAEDKMEVLKW
jgi:predicted AAA+ superfamily ATPase